MEQTNKIKRYCKYIKNIRMLEREETLRYKFPIQEETIIEEAINYLKREDKCQT